MRGIILEFLPQVAHVNAQIMTILDVSGAPDFVQQSVPRLHSAWLVRQYAERLELNCSQNDRLAADQHADVARNRS